MCEVPDAEIELQYLDEQVRGPPEKLFLIPRQPGKLLEELESLGIKMEAPNEWGNESQVEVKIQSESG